MPGRLRLDEEQGFLSASDETEQFPPYRDHSPSGASSDDTAADPDAPLGTTERGNVEFGGLSLGGPKHPTLTERIASRIPKRVQDGWGATKTWVKGPQPPRIYKITPFLSTVQHVPIAILDRWAPKRIQRFGLLIFVYFCWLFSFGLILWQSRAGAEIPHYGAPVRLSCSARYWDEGNSCGIGGDQCRPFSNATLAFRCPADCHKIQVLNPHAVGDQNVVYQPLVVGGPKEQQTGFEDVIVNNAIYRGDSFICASAVHAGFIKDEEGGCGVLTLTGEQSEFPSSKRFKIPSVGFDSYFPHTFGFLSGTKASCQDLRWPALIPSVIFTSILSIFTTSPAVFFWSIFVALFFHVGLASDPPANTTFSGLLSITTGRLLPAAFCMSITYLFTVRRSLKGLTAQLEKTVLWLGPAWVGALNNYTFDRIPIQRLTPHDIKAQPGAVPALIIIVLTIFCIALGQAWAFRVEGRMPRYLALYSGLVLGILLLLAVPGQNVRIHHYILGLLLLPGTSFQNRPSLVYQGLLTGLFVNGIARWGFDSILQTPGELLQGAQRGSLLPAISVLSATISNITFDLGHLPRFDQKAKLWYDGVSVLVNDVERFRGYSDDDSYWDDFSVDADSGNFTWTWDRHNVGKGELSKIMPEYFRFGYMHGNNAADFGKAGKWHTDGDWTPMKGGPSK
ncbi:hypothetical protein K431DRAFT_287181 [Polychaeton citri CBS 116435]|uniref:LCCL domain-containing protein n=1 Tax=Polychaeton citri CBS 116435 TaxID=1314669 RepID=A0A9P4UKG0_9PEZI|nr:hypothetical protein K431DRAFT_287181 [Polychaeton citri CBS 116435]